MKDDELKKLQMDELKKLDLTVLKDVEKETVEKIRLLRFKMVTGGGENNVKIRYMKRGLARVKTLRTEKEKDSKIGKLKPSYKEG